MRQQNLIFRNQLLNIYFLQLWFKVFVKISFTIIFLFHKGLVIKLVGFLGGFIHYNIFLWVFLFICNLNFFLCFIFWFCNFFQFLCYFLLFFGFHFQNLFVADFDSLVNPFMKCFVTSWLFFEFADVEAMASSSYVQDSWKPINSIFLHKRMHPWTFNNQKERVLSRSLFMLLHNLIPALLKNLAPMAVLHVKVD